MARTRVPVAGTIGKSIKTVSSATDLTALTAAVALLQQQVANLVVVANSNPSGLSPTDWSLISGIPPDVKNRPPGFEGEPGPEGERGPPGLQGAIGLKGDRGSPGDDGVPGDDGPPGIPGPQGLAGVGSQGPMGNPGMDGADGLDGNDGPPGIQGIQGTTGASGPQGGPGMDGNDGLDGNDGPPGAQGPQGITGGLGPQGVATYLEAEPGLDGNDGPPGPQGAQGVTGGQGPQGIPGFEGDIGELGDVGPPGPQGPTGPQGAQGATGNAIYQITFGEDGGASEPDFPLLDLGISPRWGGLHTFDNENITSSLVGSILLRSTNNPILGFTATSNGANAKVWDQVVTGNSFLLRTADDTGGGNKQWLGATRAATSTTIASIAIGNSTDKPTVGINGGLNAALSIFSADINGLGALTVWDGRFTIFGPNVASATGAACGFGYDQTNDRAVLLSLAPNVAWKPFIISGSTLGLWISGAEAITINGAPTTGTQSMQTIAGNKPGNPSTNPSNWLPVLHAGVQYYIPMWQ